MVVRAPSSTSVPLVVWRRWRVVVVVVVVAMPSTRWWGRGGVAMVHLDLEGAILHMPRSGITGKMLKKFEKESFKINPRKLIYFFKGGL